MTAIKCLILFVVKNWKHILIHRFPQKTIFSTLRLPASSEACVPGLIFTSTWTNEKGDIIKTLNTNLVANKYFVFYWSRLVGCWNVFLWRYLLKNRFLWWIHEWGWNLVLGTQYLGVIRPYAICKESVCRTHKSCYLVLETSIKT